MRFRFVSRSIVVRGVLVLGIVILTSAGRAVAAQETSASSAPQAKPPAAPAADAAPAAKDGQPPQASGESWRYKRHQGVWWYWLPTNQWVYWSGKSWVNYDADGYREFKNSQRSNTGSYSGSDKLWGPVHYDRWGQPQYPYSRRTSGIRQLGPVPAMGGFRSLPGWGGER